MWKALLSGLAGACALNILHETARQFIKDAPRVDITGERALAGVIEAVNGEAPAPRDLYYPALAGDLASNALYYSLVGIGNDENTLTRGSLLGLAAGVGAVYLPEHLGLGKSPTRRTPQTAAMTVAWYTFGGIAAALTYQALTEAE
jgi:hypothetical protein